MTAAILIAVCSCELPCRALSCPCSLYILAELLAAVLSCVIFSIVSGEGQMLYSSNLQLQQQ